MSMIPQWFLHHYLHKRSCFYCCPNSAPNSFFWVSGGDPLWMFRKPSHIEGYQNLKIPELDSLMSRWSKPRLKPRHQLHEYCNILLVGSRQVPIYIINFQCIYNIIKQCAFVRSCGRWEYNHGMSQPSADSNLNLSLFALGWGIPT